MGTLGSKKSRFWLLASTPLMSQRKKIRSMTLVKSYISIAIKKATLLAITSSQKTNVGLNNFCAGNW